MEEGKIGVKMEVSDYYKNSRVICIRNKTLQEEEDSVQYEHYEYAPDLNDDINAKAKVNDLQASPTFTEWDYKPS